MTTRLRFGLVSAVMGAALCAVPAIAQNTSSLSHEIILDGLRGCCGQMDIQCCKDNLLVSENTKFKIGIYDKFISLFDVLLSTLNCLMASALRSKAKRVIMKLLARVASISMNVCFVTHHNAPIVFNTNSTRS